MTTLGALIEETREHLLAGDRETINLLMGNVDNVTTTLTFQMALNQMQPGVELSIDTETIYVWEINEQARTATVLRGYKGTTAAAHTDGTLVYVNALFSGFRIFQALNQEIRDLGAPPNGLFQVKHYADTTQPVRMTYPVPTLNNDVYYIVQVNYHEPGPLFAWVRMTRWDFEVLRGFPTDVTNNEGFVSGMAVKINKHMYPGRVLNIAYSTGFSELVNLTDDVAVTTGLPTTAVDIPPLGAAARLMGVREAKRAFVEAEVDTRRAAEVPVGAATKAAQTLLELLNERIRTELQRLLILWPERR